MKILWYDFNSMFNTFLFTGQTQNVLNFSAKELSFDDSDSGSGGKF